MQFSDDAKLSITPQEVESKTKRKGYRYGAGSRVIIYDAHPSRNRLASHQDGAYRSIVYLS